jgi:hypothetical protein
LPEKSSLPPAAEEGAKIACTLKILDRGLESYVTQHDISQVKGVKTGRVVIGNLIRDCWGMRNIGVVSL